MAEGTAGSDGQRRGFRFVGRDNLTIEYWEGE
jgi:hypothetical protein